jgi:hypothetical protein
VRPPLEIVAERNDGSAFALQPVKDAPGSAPNEQMWTSEPAVVGPASGTLVSHTFYPTLPYLRLDVTGRIRKQMSLKLQDGTAGESTRFRSERKKDGWRTDYVRVPGASVRLIARDENPVGGFAFRSPREIGRWSYYTERLLLRAPLIIALGVAIAVALIIHGYLIRAKSPA